MSYKTILVHADKSRHTAQRVRLAAQIALANEAHLIGAAMSGLSRYAHPDGSIAPPGAPFPFDLSFLHARASVALDSFTDSMKQLGVSSYEARRIDDDPEGGLIQQSCYTDLLVVGQSDPDERTPSLIAQLPQYVMLHCVRPVLIVPYAGQFDRIGQKIVIGWDASPAATRAIAGAMPLLRHASQVTLAVFNPAAQRDRHGEQPGADMALYLARHGIAVEVLQQETPLEAGAALLSLATDRAADLLVMGGYGRLRWREMILGGATHSILHAMTLPVLMAH